ncbi:hypothetical protein BCR35DRAFT_142258 [Leucosporidium creatinivorum]|uniref:Uncharacterized protein n=1 Tax=Leucosporidium creatinivorum TaxID=106004 RepID=A0A1Y2ES08_9BASI|nr:hypothetical protein BCR35DRAFT_142258 [Leucosporidium creatinivorum]
MKLKRHLIELILSLVLFSSSTTAWLGARAGKRGGAAQLGEIEVKGVGGASEVQSLLADMEAEAALRTRDSVTPPSSNPSCFFLALSALPSSAPCEALSRSDSARIEVAASMAICEIKTAGDGEGKMPRECSDWKKGKSKVGSCVEALARSPQHWSSYSGYLREVVTLCSSYRRWADLQNARDLHASTATTFAAFVEQLQGFEEARARREAVELVEKKTSYEASLNGFCLPSR